jgi:hypothetical protein
MKTLLPAPAPSDDRLLRLAAPAGAAADNLAGAGASNHRPGDATGLRPGLRIVGDGSTDAWLRADLAAAARHYLRARRERDALFPAHLFADPAWDMLLDLFACSAEGRRTSARDLCVAADVPPATALRWLDRLEALELVRRRPDPSDARNDLVALTVPAIRTIGSWLEATFAGRA